MNVKKIYPGGGPLNMHPLRRLGITHNSYKQFIKLAHANHCKQALSRTEWKLLMKRAELAGSIASNINQVDGKKHA